MITVWYSFGAVQTYPDLASAEKEIAEIIEFDHQPVTLVQDNDNTYRYRVTVKLEPIHREEDDE